MDGAEAVAQVGDQNIVIYIGNLNSVHGADEVMYQKPW